MATRKKMTDPRSGKSVPVYLRISEYLRYYLDRKCDANEVEVNGRWRKMTLTEAITRSVQDGEYYEEDLARSVRKLFEARPDIKDEYYGRYQGARAHHSYVTELPLGIETLAVSAFIRDAIDEKIARDAPDYEAEGKAERLQHWDWLHQNSQQDADESC